MHTFHPKSLVWTREPQAFEISENKITITTVPVSYTHLTLPTIA